MGHSSTRNLPKHNPSFDFRLIARMQQEIRTSFRRITLSNEKLDKGLRKSHDTYFKGLMKAKKKEM